MLLFRSQCTVPQYYLRLFTRAFEARLLTRVLIRNPPGVSLPGSQSIVSGSAPSRRVGSLHGAR